jgi:NitT/TauT family transport system substrate-binding protein
LRSGLCLPRCWASCRKWQAPRRPEKRKVNVATASLGLPYLPLIIAQQRKYFADEGLEVEIAAFAGGSKALQSLMGGSSDVASGAYSNTLTMAAKGQKLKNFVVQVRYPALTIAVSKKVGDRYKSLKDLKGMKIGVSAPGSSTHMVVNHLLSKAGLTSNDVSIIGVGTSAGAVAAIQKGEPSAMRWTASIADPRLHAARDLGGPRPRTPAQAGSLATWTLIGAVAGGIGCSASSATITAASGC